MIVWFIGRVSQLIARPVICPTVSVTVIVKLLEEIITSQRILAFYSTSTTYSRTAIYIDNNIILKY